MANIVVVGSINMDIVNNVYKHPLPGETIKSLGTNYYPGGKGGNQAVAASLAGGTVTMVGAVGRDSFGKELVANLNKVGVFTQSILYQGDYSGIAFITVDSSGENSIILSEGANGQLIVDDVKALLSALDMADVVLLQNEIPWETTDYVMQEAKRRGIRVFLNLAPAFKPPLHSLALIDVIILNEVEAEMITGISVDTDPEALQAAKKLMDWGVGNVIITLGQKGAIYINEHTSVIVPAFTVTPVDTTAAGDTFVGAFTVASLTKGNIEESLRFASAAAAITVTRKGAQSSIPNREEIEQFLKETSNT